MGSQASVRSVRGSVAVAAVGAMVAALLAVLGLTATPAFAADNITFRASAQAVVQPAHRSGDHPCRRAGDRRHAAVRHEQQGPGVGHHAACRLDARGHAAVEHRHRDHPLQQGRGGQRRRHATRPSTSRRPPSRRSSCSPTTAPPPTRSRPSPRPPRRSTAPRTRRRAPTWRPPARTSSPTGRTSPLAPPPAGPFPAGQTQRSAAAGTGAGRITSVASDLNAPVGHRRDHRRAPPRAPSRRPRRRCGRSCCRPTRPSNPNVAPVASFTVELPAGDLHRRRLRFDRHRARHRRVLRLELRRRHRPAPA